MTDEKRYKTEWSFSFDKLGQDIGGFVKSLGVGDEETIKQGEFSAPIEGATSANVRIDFAVGENTVRGLTNLDNLIEADLTYVGEINFVVSGEAERSVALSQKSAPADWVRNVVGWIGSQGKLRWDVGLATQVPTVLEIHAGVGKSALDLHELQLTRATVYGGAGEIDLTLPDSDTPYAVTVHAGVGEVDITIPAGATVDLNIHGGTGQVEVEIGAGAQVNAEISGGVGETKLRLADGTAARFEAEQSIGDLSFGQHFSRISGSDDFVSKRGVWETADFTTAERKVSVRYKGGVGALNVK
jgi:hypothetical protein